MTPVVRSKVRTGSNQNNENADVHRAAKFRPANTSGHLIRDPVFVLLDAALATSSIVWLSAPAGSGKSSLLASYADHRSHPRIWYRVDEADNDPQVLRQSLSVLSSVPHAGAVFEPDHFYAHVDTTALIVFDDMHRLSSAAAIALLVELVRCRPRNVRLCFISRDTRPSWWERTECEAASLDWNAIRLSSEEALALAPRTVVADADRMASWLALIDGWVAAAAFLAGAMAQPEEALTGSIEEAHDSVDQFLHAELLDALSADEVDSLLILSALEQFTLAEASELTRCDAAAPLLQRMLRTATFVYGTEALDANTQTLIRMHPLLRACLRREAQRRLGTERSRPLARRAAEILERRGETAQAVRLWRDGQDWGRIADTLERRAREMILSGAGNLWREWKQWLPQDVLDKRPLLGYWEGYLLNASDGKLARDTLRAAGSLFAAQGDALGSLRCIALIVDTLIAHYDNDTHHLMRESAAEIKAGLARLDPDSLSPDDDILIHSRLVVAIVYAARRDCISLYRAVQRCVEAMPRAQDDEGRLTSGICLLIYAHWFPFEHAAAFIDLLAPLAAKATVSPLMRAWWYLQLGRWHYDFRGDLARAEVCMQEAEAIADAYDLTDVFAFHLDIGKLLVHISAGEFAAAAPMIGAMRPRIAPGRQADGIRFMMAEAAFHAGRGDMSRALELATEVFRDESRIAPSEVPRFARLRAALHAMSGDHPACEAWSQRAIDAALCHDVDVSIQSREVLRAYERIRTGNRRGATAILSQVLARPDSTLTEVLFARLPAIASVIAGFALEEGIEAERMTAIIERQRLRPRDPANPAWPWKIAVRALGTLEIAREGQPVGSGGKVQQRPLLLLKALVAAGPAGRPMHSLADQLWPDSDDARAAMNTTVHRLRKLLGHDDSVRLRQGALCLDAEFVWTDVDAFLTVCERINGLPDDVDTVELIRHGSVLRRLYRGPLCDADAAPWLDVARDRYRNLFVNACARLGGLLEAAQAFVEARALYLDARDAEPLAEVIYRGLMRCTARLEGKDAVADIYRRCRDTLSVILGSQPSADTIALARTIADAADEPSPQGRADAESRRRKR